MSSVFSRRVALSMIGTGSLAFLAACGSAKSSTSSSSASSASSDTSAMSSSSASEGASAMASGSASAMASESVSAMASERDDYSGEVKLEKYDTSAGEYEPATAEQQAKNVPVPVLPENAAENTVAGLYSNIAFAVAAMQYTYATGDAQYVEQSALNEREKKSFAEGQTAAAIIGQQMWAIDPKVTLSLSTPQPKQKDETHYSWAGTLKTVIKETSTDGTLTTVGAQDAEVSKELDIKAKYENGAWVLRGFGEEAGSGS